MLPAKEVILEAWGDYFQQMKEQGEMDYRLFLGLGTLILVHIVSYMPTFTDTAPAKADALKGLEAIFSILLIVGILTLVHRTVTQNRSS
ncbi:MAG: hypothetical protein ACFFGZ_00890 [Candidatus Thorarchaeota archaeon]